MGAILRPVTSEDGASLCDLYASTRVDEMAVGRWSAGAAATFLRQQFDAQRQHFARQFPEAAHSIIELAGRPGGRLYVYQTEAAVRVVDISLLPGHRGAGIGTSILTDLLTSAHAAGKPVRLRVATHNPAQRLYRRLGFVVLSEAGPHVQMEARPLSGRPAGPSAPAPAPPSARAR